MYTKMCAVNTDGWLILNKPAGITCTKAGAIVKKRINQKKIGHLGTLDPFACGLLPLALGQATKTVSYLSSASKTYKFILKFGTLTSTGDIEGEVIETSQCRPLRFAIENVLSEFLGKGMQVPPMYSAIKIDGKPAYVRAREGEKIIMRPRFVEIFSLTLDEYNGEDAHFTVHCGAGTYVRSLGQDIARALGSVGHLTYLQRIQVGMFTMVDSISLEELQKNSFEKNRNFLLPVSVALGDFVSIDVSEKDMIKIKNGQAVNVNIEDYVKVFLSFQKRVVAIGFVKDSFFYPKKVFS